MQRHTGAIWATENDHRVTGVGKILRSTAMDELPQLINILKGDISFVGPRAERPELVNEFKKRVRHFELTMARPGLTGVAQIFGRYDSPPRHKLRYDLLYIRNQSFLLDLKLILLSFWITLRGKWESRNHKIDPKLRKQGLTTLRVKKAVEVKCEPIGQILLKHELFQNGSLMMSFSFKKYKAVN